MRIEVSSETIQEILNSDYVYRFFYSKALNNPIWFHTKVEFTDGHSSIYCDVLSSQDNFVDVGVLVVMM